MSFTQPEVQNPFSHKLNLDTRDKIQVCNVSLCDLVGHSYREESIFI